MCVPRGQAGGLRHNGALAAGRFCRVVCTIRGRFASAIRCRLVAHGRYREKGRAAWDSGALLVLQRDGVLGSILPEARVPDCGSSGQGTCEALARGRDLRQAGKVDGEMLN